METETIASRNVVEALFTERFGHGICGKPVSLTTPKTKPQESESRESEKNGSESENAQQVFVAENTLKAQKKREKAAEELESITRHALVSVFLNTLETY